MNRERNWSNLISANKFNNRPCFWDVPNRSISKMKIETFSKVKGDRDESVKKTGLAKRFVTAVGISKCGNYGIAGFNDGYIVKVTMQGGNHNRTFFDKKAHFGKRVIGLFSDSLNHFMISCDDTSILRWDFYSA